MFLSSVFMAHLTVLGQALPYIVILDFLVVLRGFYAAQLSC
jgi:hypothetical protein